MSLNPSLLTTVSQSEAIACFPLVGVKYHYGLIWGSMDGVGGGSAVIRDHLVVRTAPVIYLQQTMRRITLGAVSIRKTVLPGMAIPMLKIRRPNGRLIFNMEIAIRR